MKRVLCALLCALLLCGAALAETAEPEAAATPETEIVALEEVEVASEEAGATEETVAPSAPAATPETATVRVGFEDGFALELPEGWLHHPTTEEMAEQGVVYCLSDAAGEGWLYIQSWESDCAGMGELKALIDRTAGVQTSGIYSFNGADFVVYDLEEGDVSCCAALLDDQVFNLVFTPQSDADFMAVAAQILNTFELL